MRFGRSNGRSPAGSATSRSTSPRKPRTTPKKRSARSFSIAGSILTVAVPGSAPECSEIAPEHTLALRRAMAAQDMPAIRALDAAWVKGYRAERDASYCADHLE